MKIQKLEENLRKHEFASGKLDGEDIKKIIVANYCCEDCGISVFELSDFPETGSNIEGSNCICEDCYDKRYREICDCCEGSYEPRDEDKKYLVFSKTNENAVEKIGIYEVLKYPYFISDHFSARVLDESIKLIRECDIESMLNNIHNQKHSIDTADCICQSCSEKFALITPMAKNSKRYCDKFTRIHHNITAKGIIERGF